MKKFIYLLFIACLAVGMSSCHDRKGKASSQGTTGQSYVETPDSTASSKDTAKVELKNQVNDLSANIDSLRADFFLLQNTLYEAKADMKVMNEKITEMESVTNPWHLATGLAVLAALIACFTCISLQMKLDRSKERIRELQGENDSLRGDVLTLKSRLTKAEDRTEKIVKVVNAHKDLIDELRFKSPAKKSSEISTPPPTIEPPRFEPQVKYAEVNSGNFFLELLSSRTETCIFELALTSETEAEFTIISINKIKSFNSWDSAITCQGDVQSAHDFRLVRKGKCQLTNDNAWKITRKLEIKAI